MIEVVNVVKYYDNRAVVNNVSFTINDGSFVSIVGKSGSGKTTLINMIGAMLLPDSGKILIDGKDIIALNDKEVALYRNKSIGFVFQNFHLEPTYSVYENITLPMEISGNRRNLKNRAKEVLDMVGMSDYINKKVTTLSGGEQQRICIARAIIQQPKIILADEPCGNLDTYNSNIIMKLLRRISDNGGTVLLITHFMEEAAQADRIIVMDDGKILLDGTPSHVFEKEDVLKKCGLNVPQCTELVHRLRKEGFALDGECVFPEQCADMISRLLSKEV